MSEPLTNLDASTPAAAAAPVTDERRSYYRATVPVDSILRVRLWKIAPGTPLGHAPKPSQELKLTVRNICIGGLGITVHAKNGQPPPIDRKERLRLEVKYGEIELLVEGRLRNTMPPSETDGTIITGLQFHGRQGNLDFQKAQFGLSTIVGSIQREEIKYRQRERAAQAAAQAAA
jgi:hypothetical protein